MEARTSTHTLASDQRASEALDARLISYLAADISFAATGWSMSDAGVNLRESLCPVLQITLPFSVCRWM